MEGCNLSIKGRGLIRKIIMVMFFVVLLMMMSGVFLEKGVKAEVYSGTCGDSLRWSLDTVTGLMDITGSGAMTDFIYGGPMVDYTCPWQKKKEFIKNVNLPSGITHIGKSSFDSCRNLVTITLNGTSNPTCGTVFDDDYAGGRDVSNSVNVISSDVNVNFKKVASTSYVQWNGQRYASENIKYTIDGNEMHITGVGAMWDDWSCYPYSPWIYIVKKITISDNISHIGEYAFFHYSVLDEIIIHGKTNPTVSHTSFMDSGSSVTTKTAKGSSANTQIKAALEAEGYTWIEQTISVILPTNVSFNIDPARNTVNQVTSPDIVITNNSTAAINLSVSNVMDSSGILTQSIAATKKKSLLALLPKGTILSSQSYLESKSLKSGVQTYNVGDIPAAGGTSILNIYGQAFPKGWKASDTFQITTTFKVTANF